MIEMFSFNDSNCYLIREDNSSILVDTTMRENRNELYEKIKDKNVRLIILTHGHVDHIANAAFLSKKLNIPIAMHKDDYLLSKDNTIRTIYADTVIGRIIKKYFEEVLFKVPIDNFEPKVFLKEGYDLSKFGFNAKIIKLEGHTKGSIGILTNDNDFLVGDAAINIGRPSPARIFESKNEMLKSNEKITKVKDTTVYFGHGNPVGNFDKYIK